MKTNIVKSLSMVALVVVAALATGAVTAQAQSNRLKADVPFEFSVGDSTLPAGSYIAQSTSQQGDVIIIRGLSNGESRMRVSHAVTANGSSQARLVFHKYGQRYFLSEIWGGGESGRQVLKSKQEKALEREAKMLASNKGAERPFETVEVAAVFCSTKE
jgi:hypothetical protein